MFERARASFLRSAHALLWRAALVRYVATLVVVAVTMYIIPRSPIDGPAGGVLGVAVLLIACWYGGPGPAMLCPMVIYLLTRLGSPDGTKPLQPTGREVMTMVIMTVLTGAVGLAGQYRRRLRESQDRYLTRIREQTSALSMARILFRELDGRITVWTDGTERLFGWSSDEALGQRLHELLRSEFPIPLAEIQRELLLTGQWQGEVFNHHKDGRRLVIATHCILYHGIEGAGGRVAEVHTDVTKQREVESALRESDRQKDIFIATLAHELRNPLAPVRSGLDLIRMTREPTEDEQTVLDMMGRQLNHMVRLIDDLLDISRINTGKVKLSRQLVSLDEIVTDAVVAARPQMEAAGHMLTVRLPTPSISLHADAARLSQVLTNLLNNAAKFTQPGGMISLTAVITEREVEIEVQDNGIGISPDLLPRIFQMFAQAEDLRVRAHGGMGLGLNIVRSLVEMHGGTVSARSAGMGKGSVFSLRLPCLESVPAAASVHEAPSTGTVSRRRGRVLIVDDNRDAALLLAATLKRMGFECWQVYDGPSALAAADTYDPEAFVLDLGMPGMSGFEVARALREHPRFRHSLLIALTGWDKEDDRRQSREAGFDHHLAKPVSVEALKGILAAPSDYRSGVPVGTVPLTSGPF